MITSGLVNQKRARFENGFIHQRDANARDTTVRPHQSGFDMPILEKSSHASPSESQYTKQGTPVKPVEQVFYNDIFGKTTTPSERMYLFNMMQRLSRGGGGTGGGGVAPTPGPGGMGGGRPTTMPGGDQPSLPGGPPVVPSDGPPSLMAPTSYATASDQESFGMIDPNFNSADNIQDELDAETALSDTWFSGFKGFSDVENAYNRLVEEIRREKDELERGSEEMIAKHKASVRRGKQPEDQKSEETSFKEWSEKQLELGKQLSIKLKKARRIQEEIPPVYDPGSPPSFSTRGGAPPPTQQQIENWYGADETASSYRLNFRSFHDIPADTSGLASSVTTSTSSRTSTVPSSVPQQRYNFGVFVPGISKATVNETIAVNGVGPRRRRAKRTKSEESYVPSGTPSDDSRMSIQTSTRINPRRKNTKKNK